MREEMTGDHERDTVATFWDINEILQAAKYVELDELLADRKAIRTALKDNWTAELDAEQRSNASFIAETRRILRAIHEHSDKLYAILHPQG